MATGLYVLHDGLVMVSYGPKHIPISSAQYKANGYKPPLEKLLANSLDEAGGHRTAPLAAGAVDAMTWRRNLKSRR